MPSFPDLIDAIAAVFAGLTVLFAARTYRRQMNAQLFMEFTRRYEQIMESYPQCATGGRVHSDNLLLEESAALTSAALKYLNLCSEEFYLWKRSYLSSDIWRIWEKEMRRTMSSAMYRREWPKVSAEFSAYPEFMRYVQESQA